MQFIRWLLGIVGGFLSAVALMMGNSPHESVSNLCIWLISVYGYCPKWISEHTIPIYMARIFWVAAILSIVGLVLSFRKKPPVVTPQGTGNSYVSSENQIGGQTAQTIINNPAAETAKYVGKLVAEKQSEVVFSSKDKTISRRLEIGESGTIFLIQTDSPLFVFWERYELLVESIEMDLKISTKIGDKNGHLVAEIIKNEWKVAPPPKTWDRNYSKSALEVRNESGDIVLQVVLLPDRIRIQGEWWSDPQHGIRLVQSYDSANRNAWIAPLPQSPVAVKVPLIRPIFAYPSELHLGELA